MIRLNNKKILARQQRSQRYVIKDWVGRLKDVPAFILGNGPSINDEQIKLLDDYFVIGINRSFVSPLSSDPTIVFWQDIGLWNTEHHKLHNLQSLKICRDISDPRHIYYNFYLKGGPFRFERRTHILCGRGSTGPLAVQFAVALGCRPIIILGMDCKKRDGKSDFYGNNPHWTEHTLNNCTTGLKFIHDECPVPIINCSDNDIFKERKSLVDVVANIGKEYAWGRQKYVSKLIKNK